MDPLGVLIDEATICVESHEWLDAASLTESARQMAAERGCARVITDPLDLAASALSMAVPDLAEGYLHQAKDAFAAS
jgi:hypothetical protein